jgi:hypothetical protein
MRIRINDDSTVFGSCGNLG